MRWLTGLVRRHLLPYLCSVMYRLTLLFLLLAASAVTMGQTVTQTIRGEVIDRDSRQPLIGATVVLLDTNNLVGTTTDIDGRFRLEKVPVGRIGLTINYVGYEPSVLTNLELTSGKELVLTVELSESVEQLQEVTISAERNKAEALNQMSTISARMLSIEEVQRYAGSLNDVSRMAQNFAGVQGANDTRNDVIVRGNSPTGVLYRLEGMDIPNPNHFATAGTTGGPISILNNNVLGNSDFLTGAFPAEYGNALAGIFDLRLRNGNSEQHEFIGQLGFNGAELVAEGPISKKKRFSYLVSYRYSTLDLFKAMGVDFGSASVPNYTDASFKFHFPGKKGTTSLFGVGGHSSIAALSSDIPEGDDAQAYDWRGNDIRFKSQIGAVGVSHTQLLNETTYLKVVLSTNILVTGIRRDSLSEVDGSPFLRYNNDSHEGKQSLNFFINKKFNSRHLLKVGMFNDRQFFSLSDSAYRKQLDRYVVLSDFDGATYLLQPYAQWQYRIGSKVTLNTGLHYQYFVLNQTQAIEPRLGIRWALSDRDRVSAAYGLHSQNPPTPIFFEQDEVAPGQYVSANRKLGFTKSHHFVVAYDRTLTRSTRIKVEAYYQKLFDVPVDISPSSYSLLNQGSNFGIQFPDTMVNEGTGTNYGAEFTLEQFLHHGFYYLMTASLYESTYEGSDGVTYNSAFNGNYTFNFLAGKEFELGRPRNLDTQRKSRFKFMIDARVTWNGGQRYVPVDLAASSLAGAAVYDYNQAFAQRYPDYFRFDFRIGFKRNGQRVAHELAIDLQNITNRKNVFISEYNPDTDRMETTYQLGLLPIVQYRVLF